MDPFCHQEQFTKLRVALTTHAYGTQIKKLRISEIHQINYIKEFHFLQNHDLSLIFAVHES